MSDIDTQEGLLHFIREYIKIARKELDYRWTNFNVKFENYEAYQVIGALMARQVTLATQMASSPMIWNNHMAPIIHRTMADVYITFAWILKDPLDRSKKYISYGLGQNKLILEHRKAKHKEGDTADQEIIDAYEQWANTQRYTFLTDIDLGSWSGLTTRKMAEEADCIDFYNYVYITFSPAAHSMWNHVGRFNVIHCKNLLHRYHLIPIDPDFDSDIFNLYLAAKYLDKTFRAFDSTYDKSINFESSFRFLCRTLDTDDKDKENV